MRAVLAGAALAVLAVTPTLADYYIVQEPSTKRCRIVEERPAPGIGVIIGGVGFGVRTEAESRMRTECDLSPLSHPPMSRVLASFAVRPIFGSPAGRVFRLGHGGGLAAPS
jgi:hypothetical protein